MNECWYCDGHPEHNKQKEAVANVQREAITAQGEVRLLELQVREEGEHHARWQTLCEHYMFVVDQMKDALSYVRSEWSVHPPCSSFLIEKVHAALSLTVGAVTEKPKGDA